MNLGGYPTCHLTQVYAAKENDNAGQHPYSEKAINNKAGGKLSVAFPLWAGRNSCPP